MAIGTKELSACIAQRCGGLTQEAAADYAARLLAQLDPRLEGNLREWMENRPVSDVWIGQYCVNAILSIRGDGDFLSALEAMNAYLRDADAGKRLIWRGRL